MLPSAKGLSSTFMLSQFTYFSPPQEANTCELCIDSTYLHIALIILLYVDNIHEIYMLQVESNRWNLIFFCVASMPLLWIIALWVNSYARLIDACLEVLFMKSLCYMIHLFTHVIYIILIAAFTTYALQIVWSSLWWHVTPEIIFVIVLPARDEQN